MPIVFVDRFIPAAAIALNGKVIGHEINKEFKNSLSEYVRGYAS